MKLGLIIALYPVVAVLGSLGGPPPHSDNDDQNHRELIRQRPRPFRRFWWLFNRPGGNPNRPDIPPNPPNEGSDSGGSSQTRTCAGVNDCEVGEYCSSGECQSWGSCLNDFDCRNPRNQYEVIECTGPLECTDGMCGRECGPNCPDGTNGVNCFASPCSVLAETNSCNMSSSYENCVDDYCGGCSAVFFNTTGNHEVCPDNTSSSSCFRTSDCPGGYYCASGECLEMATCKKTSDCRNPLNDYIVADCLGPIFCDENFSCAKECANTECPGGEDPVNCFESPCASLQMTCEDKIFDCIDDYCGGCNAFAFDEAGNSICEGVASPSNNEGGSFVSCIATRDCPADHYCGGGECLPMAECKTDLDCKNPNNVYPLAACVGYIHCNEDNECGIDCAESECGPNVSPVNCYGTPPCDFVACDEPYEECINDNCGGCNAIFLDFAGNRICET